MAAKRLQSIQLCSTLQEAVRACYLHKHVHDLALAEVLLGLCAVTDAVEQISLLKIRWAQK